MLYKIILKAFRKINGLELFLMINLHFKLIGKNIDYIFKLCFFFYFKIEWSCSNLVASVTIDA